MSSAIPTEPCRAGTSGDSVLAKDIQGQPESCLLQAAVTSGGAPDCVAILQPGGEPSGDAEGGREGNGESLSHGSAPLGLPYLGLPPVWEKNIFPIV